MIKRKGERGDIDEGREGEMGKDMGGVIWDRGEGR